MGWREREEKWVKERQIVGLDLERESFGGLAMSGFERKNSDFGFGD